MAVGERFRSGGARGIARFLADHQDCDVGFDVRREAGAGTGRLSITCKGCGAGITYKAAEAGELAAGPQVENGGAGLAEPPPAPKEDAFKPVPRSPRRSTDRRLTGWIPMFLIGALVVAGLVLIAVGVLRSDGESDSSGPTAPTPTENTAPAETTPRSAPPAQAPPPPQREAPEVRLKRRDFEQRFAIGARPLVAAEADAALASFRARN